MKAAIIALVLGTSPAQACHHYSTWKYPWPQPKCGLYTRVSQERLSRLDPGPVPVPPVRALEPDFPLPNLTDAVWDTALDTPGQLELRHDMERVKALRRLEEEMQ
jgi:hypothetical protein